MTFAPPKLPVEEWSLAMRFAAMPEDERQVMLDELEVEDAEALLWDWDFWARPKQQEPSGDWRTWLLLAGRGFGKTRTGAEWVRRSIESGQFPIINVVGATAADTRDIIVEGPAGIMSVCPPHLGARYQPTKRKISFDNGGVVMCFSADEPDRLRGHQCYRAWADELAAWRYDEAWTQLMLGLRQGHDPRVVVTTTPKPTRLIKRLYRAESTFVTSGSTYENWDNLARTFTEEIVQEYEGRRIGRQELWAEILTDSPGALWDSEKIAELRINDSEVPDLERVVVAVDPAVSFDSEEGNETGIVVVGLAGEKGYVLEDLSARLRPEDWAKRVLDAYYRHNADRVVAEVNQGYDMVEHTLRVYDPSVSYAEVRATRGKQKRAEPVAALYERGKVHHVGFFNVMEDQMTSWEPDARWSPDRLDALVWGLTHLMVNQRSLLNFPQMEIDPEMHSTNYWRSVEL